MNIMQWHLALEKAGLREKYNNTIEGFKHGFHQGIPPHSIDGLRWYTPPNHATADLAIEEIEANFRKELAAGRIFGPFSHEEVAKRFPFFRSSPLGTAANSDGSFRPINNLLFPYKRGNIPSVNLFVDIKRTLGPHGMTSRQWRGSSNATNIRTTWGSLTGKRNTAKSQRAWTNGPS
jgi:hypothetical protein